MKEDNNKLTEVWMKNEVHYSLEGGMGITETEWHDKKFIVAIMGSEGCLVYIICMNSLMIARTKIQFRKILCLIVINHVIHSWN